MQQMSATELSTHLKAVATAPTLLDVREEWEYQTCHLPNSLHIPMNDVPNSVHQLDQENAVVVICHHGMRSLQVAHYLESIGFENVINLRGGIDAWSREVDESVPIY